MSSTCSKNSATSPRRGLALVLFTGALIGALNLFHYLISSYIPDAHKFGIFPGGSILLAPMWFAGKLTPQFKAIVVLGAGIVCGSFVVSIFSGKLSLETFRQSRVDCSALWKAVVGGLLMGFGLLLSEGCLVRHTLTGLPLLQLSSIVSLLGMVMGMWLGVKLLAGK